MLKYTSPATPSPHRSRILSGLKIPLVATLLFLSACSATLVQQNTDKNIAVLFLGDSHFGESYGKKVENRYAMDAFQPLLLASDFTIANLETPLTNMSVSPLAGTKDYIHRSDPEKAASTFKKYGFDAFSLGNNHTMDYGWKGLQETLTTLENAGFSSFGAGETAAQAATPLFQQIPLNDGSKKMLSLAVFGGFEYRPSYENHDFYAAEKPEAAGVNPITQEHTLLSIKEFRAKNPDAFIVIFPHWGENYAMKSAQQQQWGHAFLDAGADLIIGQGAHLFQEIEDYKGKWIVYGLGNFIFQAPGRYQKMHVEPYSVIARLLASASSRTLRLYPIFSDNLVTDYHSRFVTQSEWSQLVNRADLHPLTNGKDAFGYYFQLSVGQQ